MISFPLTIRLASQAVHTPAAWFIPGDDPQVWLEEIARWNGEGNAECRMLNAEWEGQSDSASSIQNSAFLAPSLTLRRSTGGGDTYRNSSPFRASN